MKVTFVSNYINHHQIPFCEAMCRLTEGGFFFVQTEKMEQERVQMGWQQVQPDYVKRFYEEPEECKALIMDSDVVIFGGCGEEDYIAPRLEAGKVVVRYMERLYKTGQWKAVSPRGLRKKYHDHTRYRKAPVYLLCAGAYVASDFHIVRAYPGKMYCWGYFPETRVYEIEQLLADKGYRDANGERCTYLLWAGRFIDWKHPELVVETARYLKDKGVKFKLDMIGGGPLEEQVRLLIQEYGLEEQVCLAGYKTPDEVRKCMEQADIYLLTSDRQEGWGAVANEAMNSGCALVADHMVGAAPYLIRQGENGFVYKSGCKSMLFETVEGLTRDVELRQSIGRAAYETISKTWNAENGAKRLYALLQALCKDRTGKSQPEAVTGQGEERVKGFYPCMPAPVISERRMFSFLTKDK
ncbi:MAG: glycosyltransferase [Lachnospiraceae bacterium]|nr:glycosyltransferase [Lachnospiraceae bacterium]